MPRRTPSEPRITPLDAGICFMALDHFRQLGLPCVSAAEVLRFLGVDTTDPEVVEDERLRLMLRAQTCLVDGMLLGMSALAGGGV